VPAPGARPAADTGAEEILRYGFRVADIGLLLGSQVGAELVSRMPVSPIPNAPAWLQGLMNLRGNLVPVVDVAAVLGLESDAKASPLVLVFGKGDRAVGVRIAAAPEALKGMAPIAELPPLPERLAAHAGSGYLQGQAFWVDFKHDSFFESLAADWVGA
jgi:chemotaxis signal transduction protein